MGHSFAESIWTRVWLEENGEDEPQRVSTAWPTDFRLPPFLTLYAPDPNEWMGVLEVAGNRLWEITAEGDIEWIPEFGGRMDFPRVTRAVVKYFEEFERRENEVLGP